MTDACDLLSLFSKTWSAVSRSPYSGVPPCLIPSPDDASSSHSWPANAINYFAESTIFTAIGVTNGSLYTGIYGALKAVASVVFLGFLVDRVGRRPPLLVGGVTMALCMFYLGAYIQAAHPKTYAAGTLPRSVIRGGEGATAAVFIFGMAFAASWNGLAWIICSELFPGKIRGFCAGYTAMCRTFSAIWSHFEGESADPFSPCSLTPRIAR